MRLSACVDSIFRGIDPACALDTLASAGFTAYKFWDWQGKDLESLASAQRRLNLTPAACCTSYFDMVNPDNRARYIEALKASIVAAQSIGCKMLITQTGNATGRSRNEQFRSMIDCLSEAAPLLESAGISLLVEPLNQLDHTGHFLSESGEAISVIRAVGHPNVRMLFDLYHQQVTEGDLIRHLERALPYVSHIHAASNPGRNELDYGELCYKNIFKWLDSAGYDGYVGLEYFPIDPPERGLMTAIEML